MSSFYTDTLSDLSWTIAHDASRRRQHFYIYDNHSVVKTSSAKWFSHPPYAYRICERAKWVSCLRGNVMFCTSVKYLDLHLPPPPTLLLSHFKPMSSAPERADSYLRARNTHYIYIYIYLERGGGRWGGASVDGWEIFREMVWLARSDEMFSKNICLTRCMDMERRCRFRAVTICTAEWSPTAQGGPNMQIVLYFLCQTYLNIINFILNKFRLYLIMIRSFKQTNSALLEY
jgi:hypothetical protein